MWSGGLPAAAERLLAQGTALTIGANGMIANNIKSQDIVSFSPFAEFRLHHLSFQILYSFKDQVLVQFLFIETLEGNRGLQEPNLFLLLVSSAQTYSQESLQNSYWYVSSAASAARAHLIVWSA